MQEIKSQYAIYNNNQYIIVALKPTKMQQSLPFYTQNTQYSTLHPSQTHCNINVISKNNNFVRMENANKQLHFYQDQNLLLLSQNRRTELQKNQEKVIYNFLVQSDSDKCSNCAKWKNWAFVQQKMLLQLQRQMILKEQKIQQIIYTYKREIMQQTTTISHLELKLQQKINQISNLQQTLLLTNEKIKEIQERRKVQESSKKQNKIDFLTELSVQQNNYQPISSKDLQNFNKLSNLTTDSTFTLKTEGSYCSETFQTMKKKLNQKNLDSAKSSQFQKLLFQNQALKDYNSSLVERLKMKKYKGNMC